MQSLFVDSQLAIDSFLYRYSLQASKEFIECADKQLTEQFILQTGIKPGKNVCFSFSSHSLEVPIYGEYIIPGTNIGGRKLCINLYVNHNWNPVTIYWKSKSGKEYKLHEINIDSQDIEFWFESLNPGLYLKQLFPNQKLPFKTDNLSFILNVYRLNIDATMMLTKKSQTNQESQEIILQIYDFIDSFNIASEKKNRNQGVIHNYNAVVEGDKIRFEIDLGSASIQFYKKLLQKLSGMDCFQTVDIE